MYRWACWDAPIGTSTAGGDLPPTGWCDRSAGRDGWDYGTARDGTLAPHWHGETRDRPAAGRVRHRLRPRDPVRGTRRPVRRVAAAAAAAERGRGKGAGGTAPRPGRLAGQRPAGTAADRHRAGAPAPARAAAARRGHGGDPGPGPARRTGPLPVRARSRLPG